MFAIYGVHKAVVVYVYAYEQKRASYIEREMTSLI